MNRPVDAIETPSASGPLNKYAIDVSQAQMPHLMSKGFGLVPLAVTSNPDVSIGAKAAGLMRAYVRRDAVAIGVQDLPYGIVRFVIPRREIPRSRREGGALYVA